MHPNAVEEEGISVKDMQQWLRQGLVRKLGQWYVNDEADTALVAILAHGCRPTCTDAAILHGLWVPPYDGIHVQKPRVGPSSPERPFIVGPALRSTPTPDAEPNVDQAYLFHRPVASRWPDEDPVPDLPLVITHAAYCLPVWKTAILIESALNLGALGMHEALDLITTLPGKRRRQLERVRADAQSGTETAVRWWLESIRVPVRSQVYIDGVGFVDLLIGNSWVIECDGRAYHDNESQYYQDRRRDLRLGTLGYHVTRLTWEHVFLDWATTEAALLTKLRRRTHRHPIAG